MPHPSHSRWALSGTVGIGLARELPDSIPRKNENRKFYVTQTPQHRPGDGDVSDGSADGDIPPAILADSIVLSHSIFPDIMQHMFMGIGKMMSDDLPLTRREHELIATVTSAANSCFY